MSCWIRKINQSDLVRVKDNIQLLRFWPSLFWRSWHLWGWVHRHYIGWPSVYLQLFEDTAEDYGAISWRLPAGVWCQSIHSCWKVPLTPKSSHILFIITKKGKSRFYFFCIYFFYFLKRSLILILICIKYHWQRTILFPLDLIIPFLLPFWKM